MFSRLRRLFRRTNVDVTETREKRKEAGLSSESNEGRRRWSCGMWRVGRRTSSPASVLMKKLAMVEEERLTEELELITQKRNEVRDRVIFLTEGSINKRPFHRVIPQYEQFSFHEKEVISFRKILEIETTKARESLQELKKETNFYSNLQNRRMTEKNLVKENIVEMSQAVMAVYVDFNIIEKYLDDFNPDDKDEQEKTSNLQTQHHQVSEAARGLQLDTSQKEDLLQNELPPQKPTAELPPQQPENSLDKSSSTEFIHQWE